MFDKALPILAPGALTKTGAASTCCKKSIYFNMIDLIASGVVQTMARLDRALFNFSYKRCNLCTLLLSMEERSKLSVYILFLIMLEYFFRISPLVISKSGPGHT